MESEREREKRDAVRRKERRVTVLTDLYIYVRSGRGGVKAQTAFV